VIIRVENGRSFKGAELYYLHDKRLRGEEERFSKERVAWTYAVNTLEEDPEHVLAEMRRTSFDQPYLKMVSGNRVDGSPTLKPVYTVALSWSPDMPAPSKQQMIEGGQSYLQHMGWQEHQALMVCHTDTRHPHLHLIVNAVHPQTGMTFDYNWYKTRSSRWGLAYERENGKVLCLAREARHAGHSMETQGPVLHYGQWKTWQEVRQEAATDPEYTLALQSGEWATLKGGQRAQRIAYWKQSGEMRRQLQGAIRDEVRAEFAPEWKAYADHRADRMKAARQFDLETRRALRHYRRHGPLHGVGAVKELKGRKAAYHAKLKEDLAEQRADINARVKARSAALSGPALAKLAEDRKAQYQNVLARERGEKGKLAADQAQGRRRHDVLGAYDAANHNRGGGLTVEQIKAYKDHARDVAAQRQQFDQARGEVEGRDRADPKKDAETERKARTEQQDKARDKTDKERHQERTDARLAHYLAERKAAGRDRGGGGRER